MPAPELFMTNAAGTGKAAENKVFHALLLPRRISSARVGTLTGVHFELARMPLRDYVEDGR